MEKLFYYFVFGAIGIAALKVLAFHTMQKLLHQPKTNRRSGIDAEAQRISSYFNALLKQKALKYTDINIIYNILKKYAEGKKYNSNIHLVYSVLKHSKSLPMRELGNIEIVLDTAKRKHKKTLKRT